MDMDEEDFVFYGTPIEREEELTSHKKKAVAEASGHLRTLPSWKQEVRDEEGRRRFHGAFKGGFSAGYYNTVGSKEGWTPQSFMSSRKNRAEVKQQNILNFLDDDEKAELEGRSLGTSSQFDTFGFTAAEYARKQVEKEQQQRLSVIPGPIPDEIVVPATESIGVKLLQKMGWRHGHSIKDAHANLYDARREARKAFLAFSSDHQKAEDVDVKLVDDELESSVGHPTVDDVPSSQSTTVYVLNPKQDLYGLGYDPYKNAPEFREKKRRNSEPGKRKALSMKDSLFGFKSGKAAPGFGIGALEEYDNEDEDIYSTAYDFEDTDMQEVEEPSRSSMDDKPKLLWKEQGILRGFRVASNSDYQLQRFDAPAIPKDFVPHHKFPGPLECDKKQNAPPPPEVPPPEDGNLRILIEGVATLVARCGKLFEDLSREKNQSNPSFRFLNGGNGYDYYTRKLWEEQEKQIGQKRLVLDEKSSLSTQKMNAESRGKILGEKPLDRSARDLRLSVTSADINLQFNLSDTFTKPASISELPEVAKLFKDDPAKQERFEQFLKEKYHGGLRSIRSGGNSNMSEAARARERLDFEAAAEAIEKGRLGKDGKPFSEQVLDFAVSGSMKFTSGGLEQGRDTNPEDMMTKKIYPKREEFQWRPSPILCKRFDLIDPYMGKPPPPLRIKSKMDSLMFTLDSGKATKVEETIGANRDQLSTFKPDASEVSEGVTAKENEVEVEYENLERPVDLYKAIFSDDSDEEAEASSINKVDDPQKKAEVAQMTLNRLMAGDFLESLGKELGLEVPPDLPISSLNKAGTSGSQKETAADAENADILPVGSSHSPSSGTLASMSHRMLHQEETAKEDESGRNKHIDGDLQDNSLKQDHGPSSDISGKVDVGKIVQDGRKANLSSGRHRKSSTNSSSDDERSRKCSRRHRHGDSDLYSDSSGDYQERYHSKSKGRNKESSQERRYRDSDSHSDSSSDYRERYHSRSKGRNKESSQEKRSHQKHSKHRKHRSGDSPRQSSHYGTQREHLETKKEKRKKRN